MRKKLLFLGDSNVEAGRLREECSDGLGFGFVAELAEILRSDRFELINRGHFGFTVRDVWRDLSRDCGEQKPDETVCVTVLAGVNNIPMYFHENQRRLPEAFGQEYRQLLERIQEKYPAGKLILAEPFVFRKPEELLSWRPLLRQESAAVRRLAEWYGAEFLPLQEIMDRAEDQLGTDAVTPDGLHLAGRSSRILAEQWMAVFRKLQQ